MFEVFEHTADLGLRVRGATREELFVEAARALFSVVVANPAAVKTVDHRTIRISGSELDYLLFDWLNELLYLFETQHLLLVQFTVELNDEGLTASCSGEPIDPARHVLEHEVKAITYHGLKVETVDEGWMAEVIVDI
jgi:SHS2 domain-containing protein